VHPADPAVDSPSAYSLGDRFADYRTLVKPRITQLVVVTAAIGYILAAREFSWTWLGMIGTLAGTALSCMAASVFNQIIERRTDAKMPRTADRPLAAERLPIGEAFALAITLTLAGQGLLCLLGSPLASGLAAFTILSYALIYTPLKTRSAWALYIGAVPGAMPPLIGYAAVDGTLGVEAWVIFAIMFIWQIPHFLAIGYLYKEDYAKAGMAMHAVTDPTGRSSFWRAIAWCVLLLPIGVLPTLLGFAGGVAAAVAAIAGLWFLWTAIRLWIVRDRLHARRMFFASLIYLPVVLAVTLMNPA
jgi:protoheme IX farnesyltransferase